MSGIFPLGLHTTYFLKLLARVPTLTFQLHGRPLLPKPNLEISIEYSPLIVTRIKITIFIPSWAFIQCQCLNRQSQLPFAFNISQSSSAHSQITYFTSSQNVSIQLPLVTIISRVEYLSFQVSVILFLSPFVVS